MAGYVQLLAAPYSGASGTSHPVSVTASATARGMAVAEIKTGAGVAVSTVTDSRSNTWVVLSSANTTNSRTHLAYTFQNGGVIQNGDTVTVTVASSTSCQVGLAEYSPHYAIDVSGSNHSAGASVQTLSSPSGTLNSTVADTTAISVLSTAAGSGTNRACAGYTARTISTTLAFADKVNAATGDQQAVWSWTNVGSQAAAVTGVFKQILDAAPTPSLVSGTGAVQSPTVTASAAPTPTAISETGAPQAPAVSASALVTLSVIDGTGAVQAPTIPAAAVPSTVTATGTVESPVLITSATVTPPVVTGTGSVQAPTFTASATATPAVITGSATVETPAETETSGPGGIAGTGTVYAPTVTADGLAAPSVISAVGTVPTPTVESVLLWFADLTDAIARIPFDADPAVVVGEVTHTPAAWPFTAESAEFLFTADPATLEVV